MSYVKNIDTVFNEMQRMQIRFWQVFDGNQKDIIAEASDEETLTVDDSICHLREFAKDIEGVVWIIIRKDDAPRKRQVASTELSSKVDKQRGIYKFQLMLGENTLAKANNGLAMGGMNSGVMSQLLAMQQSNFELRLEMQKKEFEYSMKMEKKLAEIEAKLKKRGGDNMVSDEYAKKGLALLQKLLDRKKDG